jgi:hypothetical protein
VNGVWIVRETVAASVAIAGIALVAGLVLGQAPFGVGLAAGLVIGSLNGELVRRVIDRRAPFVVASLMRLALLSGLAILVAYLFSASTVALLLGVAAAQAVMVGAAVRQGLRTR